MKLARTSKSQRCVKCSSYSTMSRHLIVLLFTLLCFSVSIYAQDLTLIQNLLNNLQATDADINRLGYSVSVREGVAVVGAPYASEGGTERGAVYIFYRDLGGDNKWGLTKKVINGTGTNTTTETFTNMSSSDGELFGFSLSISGDFIFVGAVKSNAGGMERGAVYVLERNQEGADAWGVVKRIVNGVGTNDALNTFVNVGSQDEDSFGWAVSAYNNTLVVGAPDDDQGDVLISNQGAAYIFEKDLGGTGNWGLRKKIVYGSGTNTANLLFINPIVPFTFLGAWFGWSVSIYEDNIIIGAVLDNQASTANGAVFVLNRNQGGSDNWGIVRQIINGTGTSSGTRLYLNTLQGSFGNSFGWFVSLYEDTAVIGAPYDSGSTLFNAKGSAYIVGRNEGGADNWGVIKKIANGTGTSTATVTYIDVNSNVDDEFGYSVGIYEDRIAIGANLDDEGGTNRGAVYLLSRNRGGANNWGLSHKIINGTGTNTTSKLFISENSQNNDGFGYAVALDDEVILVGTYNDNTNFGNVAAVIGQELLPLSSALVDFEGKRLDKETVLLSWKSNTQNQSIEYAIDFSENGILYEEISSTNLMLVTMDLTTKFYQTHISQSKSGYYRLRELLNYQPENIAHCFVDASKIKLSVKPYPNPSRNSTQLIYDDIFKNLTVQFYIYTLKGNLVFEKTGKLEELASWLQTCSEKLSLGTYLFKIYSPEGNTQQTFIKY